MYEPCPPMMIYIWEWFKELNSGRQYSEVGLLPFTFTEIKSWSELYDYDISSNDVKILKQLDMIAIKPRK